MPYTLSVCSLPLTIVRAVAAMTASAGIYHKSLSAHSRPCPLNSIDRRPYTSCRQKYYSQCTSCSQRNAPQGTITPQRLCRSPSAVSCTRFAALNGLVLGLPWHPSCSFFRLWTTWKKGRGSERFGQPFRLTGVCRSSATLRRCLRNKGRRLPVSIRPGRWR